MTVPARSWTNIDTTGNSKAFALLIKRPPKGTHFSSSQIKTMPLYSTENADSTNTHKRSHTHYTILLLPTLVNMEGERLLIAPQSTVFFSHATSQHLLIPTHK